MAILTTGNLLSEQRYDISDARRIESGVRNDFDTMVTAIFTNTSQGYIIRGFSLVTSGAIGSAANGLQMIVDNSAVLSIDASVSGTIFQTPLGTPNQVLNSATNTNVSGSFTASSTNYVGIDYYRFADPSTDVTKFIWNSAANDETTVIAPAAQTLTYKIIITNSPWAANVLPVSIVTTDSNGNVLSISDNRWNLYSLETGGISPNPSYMYPWSQGRTQSPVTTTSNSIDPFIGGDKQLDSFKAWADAIMSELLEIKGTPYWFSSGGSGPIPSIITLAQDLGNTVITGSGSLAHGVSPVDKETLTTAGQINWDQPIDIRVIGSSLTYTLLANPSSIYISLDDDEVAYITLVRDVPISPNLIFTGSTNTVNSVGSISWTSGLQTGDYIRLNSDTVAGYYEIATLGTAAMSFTDSAYAVTLTTNVSIGDSTGAGGAQALYAFGSYQAVATPTTTRDIYISTRETAPIGANLFWLFLREDNGGAPRVYVKFLGEELDNGEDVNVDGTTSSEFLLYVGGTSMTASTAAPTYSNKLGSLVAQITSIVCPAASSITSGQYFTISSTFDYINYYVWFNKAGAGGDPAVIGLTPIMVSIGSSDTATTVASDVAAALTATGSFSATSSVATVISTNSSAGFATASANFNVSSMTITVPTPGSGAPNFDILDGDNLTLAIKKLDAVVGTLQDQIVTPTGVYVLSNKTLPFLRTSVITDPTTTGADATLEAIDTANGVIRLTNGSLMSISGITAGVSGQMMVVENQTGNSITINNDDSGASAPNRISVGTSSSTLAAGATMAFVYDATVQLWMAFGGSGNGGYQQFTLVNGQASPANITGFTVNPGSIGFSSEYSIIRSYNGPPEVENMDTAFNTNLGTGFSGGGHEVIDIIEQSNGTIVAVGGWSLFNGSSTPSSIVAFNNDGTLNTSFNTNLGTGVNINPIRTISLQSNQQMVFGGQFTTFNGNTRNRFVRLNSDGTEDTAFYTNLGTAFFNGVVASTSIQSNQRILVVGTFSQFNGNTRAGIVRLNSDGTEDTAFYTNIGTGFSGGLGGPTVVYVLSNQQILVGGEFNTFNGNTRNGLVRLNSDGTEDTAFYSNLGTAYGVGSVPVAIVQQSSNNQIILGGIGTFNGNPNSELIRLNLDGTFDTAFYTNLGTGFNSEVATVALQSTGTIVVGGPFSAFNGNTRNRLVALNTDGTEDTSFYTNLGTLANGPVLSLWIESTTDNIVVGGGFTSFDGDGIGSFLRIATTLTENDLVTQGVIRGVYRPSTTAWELGGQVSTGDDPGVTFSMTSGGQMQYTSTFIGGILNRSTIRFAVESL